MPKLSLEVDSLDTIDSAHHALYVEKDDGTGYRLDVDGVEDTKALKDALRKERDAAKGAKQWSRLFPDKTPDEIAAIVKAANAAEARGDKKGRGEDEDVQRLLEKREKELKAEYEPAIVERDALKSELTTMRLDNARRTAAIAAGVYEDDVDDVLQLSRRFFDVDAKGKAIVVDEDGDPTGMSVEDFYTKAFKKLKPRFYKGTGASGSGAEQQPARKSGSSSDAPKSSVDKISAGLAARG